MSKVFKNNQGQLVRKCKNCGEVKTIDQFHKDPHGHGGIRTECKKCRNERLAHEKLNGLGISIEQYKPRNIDRASEKQEEAAYHTEMVKKAKELSTEVSDTLEANVVPLKALFFDIETSYNIGKFWRTGYNLSIHPTDIIKERAIICVSYKWNDSEEVHSIEWDENQCDKVILEQFIPVMNQADVIVAHNGDRFDMKWIRTRALKHGLEMHSKYNTIDTLKTARRLFNFNSNKLDYISEYLGFGNKLKTDLGLWDDIILRRCPEAMNRMLDYCDKDVVLLEQVYKKLVRYELPKAHVGVLNGLEKHTSPYSGSSNIIKLKRITTAAGAAKYLMKDLDDGRQFIMSATQYKKHLESIEE